MEASQVRPGGEVITYRELENRLSGLYVDLSGLLREARRELAIGRCTVGLDDAWPRFLADCRRAGQWFEAELAELTTELAGQSSPTTS